MGSLYEIQRQDVMSGCRPEVPVMLSVQMFAWQRKFICCALNSKGQIRELTVERSIAAVRPEFLCHILLTQY